MLVAGASGQLGRHVTRELRQRGYRVRAISRDPARLAFLSGQIDNSYRADLSEPESLMSACAGADAVISCVGASLHPHDTELIPCWADVDLRGTGNLLRVAREAEVSRFICVAPFEPERLMQTDWGWAREEMVGMVQDSGLPYSVVRPTMMFGLCSTVLPLVVRGNRWLLGNAEARTNPIDERDVASLCVGALISEVETIEAGGPETMTYREIASQMVRALGVASKPMHVPPWLCRTLATGLRPFRPRVASLLALAEAATAADAVAPPLGSRRWTDYLPNVAGGRLRAGRQATAARGV